MPAPEARQPAERPAWGVSIFFHAAAIALLALALRPWPRGGVAGAGESLTIVLDAASASIGESGTGDTPARLGSSADSADAAAGQPPSLLTPPAHESKTAERAANVVSPPAYPTAPAEVPAEVPAVAQAPPKPVAAAMPRDAAAANMPAKGTGDEGTAVGRGSGAGSGQGGGPGGEASVSVFGVEGRGRRFVYLFDRSASMEGAPLLAAKRQLLQSLQSLGTSHQFHIVFFNTKTHSFDAVTGGGRNNYASERNKQLAANFVGGITADGGTDRMAALRAALSFSPDVVFFLSDADDPMPESELAEVARLNPRAQTAICVIEFGTARSPRADNFLMRVARQSGGRYGYINTTQLR